jgi:hypothetical protein
MGAAAFTVARALAAAAALGSVVTARPAASDPLPDAGVDAIVAAFQQRPVVALGEFHGWSESTP